MLSFDPHVTLIDSFVASTAVAFIYTTSDDGAAIRSDVDCGESKSALIHVGSSLVVYLFMLLRGILWRISSARLFEHLLS